MPAIIPALEAIAHLHVSARLHRAVENNQPKTLAQLLSLGAPVEVRDDHGRTLLFKALSHRRLDCAKVLLSYHAMMHEGDLGVAQAYNRPDAALLLLTTACKSQLQTRLAEVGADFLMWAVKKIDVALVSALVTQAHPQDADRMINSICSPDGVTPLHHVAAHNRLDLFRVLLEHGGNLGALDQSARRVSVYTLCVHNPRLCSIIREVRAAQAQRSEGRNVSNG